VIDFDAAVRDPNAPTKLQSQYDPGDHLHMNAAARMDRSTSCCAARNWAIWRSSSAPRCASIRRCRAS
jgi:hypothetical protein